MKDIKPDVCTEDCLCRSCFRRLDRKENELQSEIPTKKKNVSCLKNVVMYMLRAENQEDTCKRDG